MSEYPREMTPELRHVLGLMSFQSGPVADALRATGEDIPRDTGAEQAHVLHWMIGLALEYGDGWREKVSQRLEEISTMLAEREKSL